MEGELVSPPGQATVSGVGVLSMKQGPGLHRDSFV